MNSIFKSPKLKVAISAISLVAIPFVSLAATDSTLATVITTVVDYLGKILFLLMAVAVVMFVWYVIKYFILPNENRKEAGLYVMYSLIGFFVILSLWGIVAILGNTFGLGNTDNNPGSWADFANIFPR